MSTYKRLCLLLCSLFMCCVGFLSVSSRAYAYTSESNFFVYDVSEMRMQLNYSWSEYVDYHATFSDGKYYFSNSYTDNIIAMVFYQENRDNDQWTFPYYPDIYDYYLLGTVTALCNVPSKSTFKPTIVRVNYFDYDQQVTREYSVSNTCIYDIDTYNYSGFGFSTKIDFETANNVGLDYVLFKDDKDGSGVKPENLVFEMGILAIEKGQSETAVLSQILNQLQNMENSLTDSIGSAADQVTDAIENQYGMIPGETFGVQDLTSQVEEKLGVLSFGADTLNNFLGLFQASNAGSTVLTFPGFTIDVQGESYQVWNDMQFDLAFLEENFGFLIDTVRTVTVLCVWLAVLGYLVKAYEHLVNNKG